MGQGHSRGDLPQRRAALRQRGREARRLAQGVLRAVPADREGLQDADRGRPEAQQRAVQEAEARLLDAAEGAEPEPEGVDRAGQGVLHRAVDRAERRLPGGVHPGPAGRARRCGPNKRGNHTWVEIWDKGWHFTGACEPDPNGLDRGWFVGDAAQAKKDVPEHAIYAASFKKTEAALPAGLGARTAATCPAENVTDRYAKTAASEGRHAASSAERSRRCSAAVEAKPASLAELARQGLRQDAADQGRRRDGPRAALEGARRDHPQGARRRGQGPRPQGRQAGDAVLLQDVRQEAGGRAGACGSRCTAAAAHRRRVNDQQWENQKKLYTLDEGIYLAPRAPTNTWNLWHEAHIDRLFAPADRGPDRPRRT